MTKENTKSPLRQDSGTKYTRRGLTGVSADMSQRMIDGAYMSVRANAPDYSWMSVVGAGVKAYKTDYDTKKD